MKQNCYTKINNNYCKSLALNELSGAQKSKTGGCPKTYLLLFKSFSLLNSKLYVIDYQLFMITICPNCHFIYATPLIIIGILDIHIISSNFLLYLIEQDYGYSREERPSEKGMI